MPLDQHAQNTALFDLACRDARRITNTLKQMHLRSRAGHDANTRQLEALLADWRRMTSTISRLTDAAEQRELGELHDALHQIRE